MRSTIGLVVLLGALLAGCAGMDPRMGPTGVLFAQDLQRMMDSYNSAHGTHYPVPNLSLDPIGLPSSVVGASDYTAWTIHINPDWVAKDDCLVVREALPHELAHLIVYYDEYGPPKTAELPTPRGMKLIAMNGPGLQDLSDEHGAQWQTVARELGADPCKEGYCYAARPYKKYPLTCAPAKRALAAVSPASSPGARLDR